MQKSSKILTIGLLAGILFIGDAPPKNVTLLYPTLQDSTMYDQGQIFLVSAQKDSTAGLLVSSQWQLIKYVDLTPEGAKTNFPKTFLRYFEPHTTIQKIVYLFKSSNIYTPAESLVFKYTDTMNIRAFWQRPEFAAFINKVQGSSPDFVQLTITGWADSSYSTPYDDPNADNRGLYKLHLRFIPGINTIYFAPAGKKNEAQEYTTKYIAESKSLEDRKNHFHNSPLEQSCNTCHEGLPSADSGMTMKADCSVCHKTPSPELTIHSPVEMKKCETCHSWSAEKKAMTVTKDVPGACFDCHADKKTLLDSAKVQHPVASDCTSCHSPHSSDQKRLLKNNTYDLCTTCHADQRLNHPVGKHPLRFTAMKTGGEISCVSCHNPHGSDNEHLLLVGGGPMAVCSKCH